MIKTYPFDENKDIHTTIGHFFLEIFCSWLSNFMNWTNLLFCFVTWSLRNLKFYHKLCTQLSIGKPGTFNQIQGLNFGITIYNSSINDFRWFLKKNSLTYSLPHTLQASIIVPLMYMDLNFNLVIMNSRFKHQSGEFLYNAKSSIFYANQ